MSQAISRHHRGLHQPPVIVGHSFGGLIAEKLLGQGVGAAAVAIDPAQIKGVLPLPLAQLRAGFPALGNPTNLHRAVSLTAKEFRFGFGNALTPEESDELYERWTIPSPARPLFQAAAANFSMHSEAKVDTDNSTRGPLLLISGLEDHTVPDVVTRSTLKQYRSSTAITELKQFEGRGHSLTIDRGWRDVADAVLALAVRQGALRPWNSASPGRWPSSPARARASGWRSPRPSSTKGSPSSPVPGAPLPS